MIARRCYSTFKGFSLNFLKKKMTGGETVNSLEAKVQKAENWIAELRAEVSKLQDIVDRSKNNQKLVEENENLKKEIEKYKALLTGRSGNVTPVEVKVEKTEPVPLKIEENSEKTVPKPKKAPKEKSEKPKEKATGDQKSADEAPVDVGRLDFRVGKIVEVKKHPDADSLYVEQIDVGEDKPRTVVSGLVKFVPIEEMQNRHVIVLCNLKPAKMRGVTSEGMVMCASTPEKVEVLIPPNGSVPGDVIEVSGFPRSPDSVLNPKKKIFETVAPELKTNDALVATYRGQPWIVAGKGEVKTASLTGVAIK